MATYAAPGVYVEEVPAAAPIVGVGTSTAAFIGVWKDPWPPAENDEDAAVTALRESMKRPDGTLKPAELGEVVSCTNFTEFKLAFGDFTTLSEPHNILAHAVRG